MGRSYQNLLTLRPGMMIYPGGGGWTMSTNGSRPEENQFILDGLTNDNPLQGLTIINGPGVAGDAATIMPIDAIQEVKIEENPKAEYGGKPGAVVNVGIKSGTNSIHGTAYAFGRDSAMDARNYFDDTSLNPNGRWHLNSTVRRSVGPSRKISCSIFWATRRKATAWEICFPRNVPEDLSQVALANPAGDPMHEQSRWMLFKSGSMRSDRLEMALASSALSLKVDRLHTCRHSAPPADERLRTICTGGLYPANATNSRRAFLRVFRALSGPTTAC